MLEEYREDFEYDMQPQQDYNNQSGGENQLNGYYQDPSMKKLPEDQFYNTYDDCMVFNEEDEDLYREQLETGKIDEPILEEYKEDFEEDFMPPATTNTTSSHQPVVTTCSNNYVETSIYGGGSMIGATTSQQSHYTTTQPIITQQCSFDEYSMNDDYSSSAAITAATSTVPTISSKSSQQRMLTKQETIMSETASDVYEAEKLEAHNENEMKDNYYDEDKALYEEENEQMSSGEMDKPKQAAAPPPLPPNSLLTELDMDAAVEIPPRKSVTIEEPVMPEKRHEKPKEKMTAKQRWHWAYNKIIHQLNVSRHLKFFMTFEERKRN